MAFEAEMEKIFSQNGFDDFKWIDPQEIVVSQWVRMKCIYGCPNYGKGASCPPNNPSVEDCKAFFRSYRKAAIFHFAKQFENPDDRHAWTKEITMRLVDLEREIFLAGYVKAFLLPMDSCELCEECVPERAACKHPKRSRPTPEGLAVDVFSTVRSLGYPIKVLKDFSDTMNRYAFLMIE
ncbi:MAG: DUF2284 domain-containing protein [Candidatus Hodarchaeales archaeon]